jgi:glycosyltransferase involved in cell wall biosynthesis
MIRVSVAPLRYGAGIKGKVGTAMALGLPVVATILATEGMALTDGENILIADDPQALVDAIGRLYRDEGLWNRISANALDFARHAWGAEAAWRNLADIVTGLGMPVTRGTHPLALFGSASSLPQAASGVSALLVPLATVRMHAEY